MKAILAILLLASNSAFANYCQPQHDEASPSVTLGTVGAETFAKAYAKLPATGGVIKVPSGNYGCASTLWVAGRTSVYKDVTIEGVGDTRPVFSCDKGTFASFGPPMYEADNVTPAPTKPVAIILKNLEFNGWVRWLNVNNVHKAAFHNVKADGRYLGVRRTGKGFVMGERVGKNQTAETEICDSDIGGAGQGNVDHPAYIHGALSIDTGTFSFVRSICRDSDGSHCVKTTAAAKVLVEDSLFLNECKPGDPCGTEQLNMVAASKLNIVRRNTFIRGNLENMDMFIPGEAFISLSNRFWYAPGTGPSGHEHSPLYDRAYGSPEYHDPAFWANAKANGECPCNEHLRLSVFHDNTFIYRNNRQRTVLFALGTYPTTKTVYSSNCLTALAPPAGWIELSRVVLGNNTYIGEGIMQQPIDIRLPNLCGAPMPPEAQPTPVWDLGGNGPEGTVKVLLPDWVKGL